VIRDEAWGHIVSALFPEEPDTNQICGSLLSLHDGSAIRTLDTKTPMSSLVGNILCVSSDIHVGKVTP
jgi:hypothetical protein